MKRIKYSELQTGDIALTSGSSALGNAIEKVQAIQDDSEVSSMYSHSGIIRRQGKVFITEAQKHGICNNDFHKRYMNSDYDSLMILRPKMKIEKSRMVEEMMPFIGNSKYDFKNLIIFQPFKILFKRWIGEKKQNTKRFICHEWTAFVYNNHFKNSGVIFPKETQVNSKDIFDNNLFEHFLLK